MTPELISHLHLPGGGAALRLLQVTARGAGGELWRGTVYGAGRGLFPVREGILDLLPGGVGPLSRAQASNLLALTARVYERPWRASSLTLFSGEPFGFDRELPLLRNLFGPPRPGIVLDLAASTALYGRALAPSVAAVGGTVVSIDLSWPMLRAARASARREGQRAIAFVRARAEALPFADGQLVGALCGGSLNEFGPQGLRPALAELYRTLAPGAPAIFMHLLAAERGGGRALQRLLATGGIVFPTRSETNTLFHEAGFEIEHQEAHRIVAFTKLKKR